LIGGTEATATGHEAEAKFQKKRSSNKSVLRLPDLEHAKAAVLNSLNSADAKRGYRYAIDEFVDTIYGVVDSAFRPSGLEMDVTASDAIPDELSPRDKSQIGNVPRNNKSKGRINPRGNFLKGLAAEWRGNPAICLIYSWHLGLRNRCERGLHIDHYGRIS
jgi:hypothetical protein